MLYEVITKAFAVLNLFNSNLNDVVFFKKGSIITIYNSMLEYFENDLL